jgi:hypothetical protein
MVRSSRSSLPISKPSTQVTFSDRPEHAADPTANNTRAINRTTSFNVKVSSQPHSPQLIRELRRRRERGFELVST